MIDKISYTKREITKCKNKIENLIISSKYKKDIQNIEIVLLKNKSIIASTTSSCVREVAINNVSKFN